MEANKKLTDYEYLYNAAAHFEAEKQYPDGLISAAMAHDADGLRALCWGLHLLMEQAEIRRGYLGMEKREIPSEGELMASMSVYDMLLGRGLLMAGINRGLRGAVDESKEIDEVLEEIEKKTGNG